MKLHADNLILTDGTRHGSSVEADITDDAFEYLLKEFFGWRTSAGYSSIAERYGRLGSHDHDRFLQWLLDTHQEATLA